MKRGAIKEVEKTFAHFLPPDWSFCAGAFRRRFGNWLHMVTFKPCRFDDTFEPVGSMGFLKMPGEVLGGYLLKGIKHEPHCVQRWVSLEELARDPKAIYQEMLRQFKPRIDAPVDVSEVREMLKQGPKYYPHLYALCVMAAEEGNNEEARYWHREAVTLIGEPKYESSFTALAEIQKIIDLMESPPALQAHLQAIVKAKLEAAKLTDLPDLAAPR